MARVAACKEPSPGAGRPAMGPVQPTCGGRPPHRGGGWEPTLPRRGREGAGRLHWPNWLDSEQRLRRRRSDHPSRPVQPVHLPSSRIGILNSVITDTYGFRPAVHLLGTSPLAPLGLTGPLPLRRRGGSREGSHLFSFFIKTVDCWISSSNVLSKLELRRPAEVDCGWTGWTGGLVTAARGGDCPSFSWDFPFMAAPDRSASGATLARAEELCRERYDIVTSADLSKMPPLPSDGLP